jgi:hypothetical protein
MATDSLWCETALSSVRCFGLYAMLMLVVGAFPALLGSVAIAALSSKLPFKRIILRVGGVWLTAFLSSVGVTGYMIGSNYFDQHGDNRIVATTVGAIFVFVTAYVALLVRRDAKAQAAAAASEARLEPPRTRSPASA